MSSSRESSPVPPSSPAPDPSIDGLVELYGSDHARVRYDETVTELEHGLQAAELASAEGASDELVAAALLHDVGHLLLRDGRPMNVEFIVDHHHEEVGADHLEVLFGPMVAEPVRYHVAAKRYLCSVESGYRASLSPSSVRSLAVQGGPMTARELRNFELLPEWRDAIRLRRWDEQAKVEGLAVPSFGTWLPLLGGLVERHRATPARP